MTRQTVAYVCVRPDHHRRRSATPRLTRYQDCCAFCPADSDEGHDWSVVPETTLEAMEEMGWLPAGAARRCREEIARDAGDQRDEHETVPS